MRFKRKPVTISAEQYTGLMIRGVCDCGLMVKGIPGGCQHHVHTMHNNQRVDLVVGDWILPEPDGLHFYPVNDEVFKSTYEPESNVTLYNPPAVPSPEGGGPGLHIEHILLSVTVVHDRTIGQFDDTAAYQVNKGFIGYNGVKYAEAKPLYNHVREEQHTENCGCFWCHSANQEPLNPSCPEE